LNKPVHTKTPAGEEVVILAVADYERLLELAEDARDLRIAERALAELASGKGETLTHAEMLELLDATSPISFWRKRRGLTQVALARAVGISQAYLAQIEGGRREGDMKLYSNLARVLGVDLEDLVIGTDDAAKPPPRRTKARRRSR
jgi:DNA-binding XRE family transcriptional regulator